MYLRIGSRAWSIGPYPVQKLWDAGWRAGLWRRVLGVCIVVHYSPTTAQQVTATDQKQHSHLVANPNFQGAVFGG
jgi:hypothetical protein